jgi:hypothetical protein
MPSCCMLEPPYILNLTNIYLQVNYCLVKQWYFFPITRTQEDRNHIISEKKQNTTSNLLQPSLTVRSYYQNVCLKRKPDWFEHVCT